MQVVVKQVSGFDVHQDEVSGEVVRVVPRTAASQPRKFESMTDDEKRAEVEKMKHSTEPVTLGRLMRMQEVQAAAFDRQILRRLEPLVERLNELTKRWLELEEKSAPVQEQPTRVAMPAPEATPGQESYGG